MLDAKPIASPTGIMPIPTGIYVMPFGIPQEQQRSCLTKGDQFNTWACNTPEQPVILRIDSTPSLDHYMVMWPYMTQSKSEASLPNFRLNYGAQYPEFNAPERLFWVTDLEDPGDRPALHFQTLHDKLVILTDEQFNPTKAKRNGLDSAFSDEHAPAATLPPLSLSIAPSSVVAGPAIVASSSAPSS